MLRLPHTIYRSKGRSFQTRCNEHIHATNHEKYTSTYAQQIQNTGHPYEKYIKHYGNNKIARRNKEMKSLVKFYISCT
jgi:hypothetical protein